MAVLTLRTLVNSGDTTKGLPLTNSEIDQNFINLDNDIALRATIASPTFTGSVTIPGGAINNTTIGATTPSTGAFTSVTTDGLVATGGTGSKINNTIIGDLTPSTGSFTTLTSSSTTSLNGTTIPASATLVKTTDNLSVLASTTSSQLAGIISDETGTGKLVFSESPTLTGTPLAPTATANTNTTQIATTAHVFAERTNTATLTNKTLTSPTISGGSINNTTVGATTPSTGAFTSLSASGVISATGNIPSTNTTTGTVVVTGGVGVSGTVSANSFSGSGSGLSSVPATGISGTLPIANGGTNGVATPTSGAVSYGTGTKYAFTAAGTSGQILKSNGTGAPTWLTTLPIANGGTNGSASPSAGAVSYGTGTAYAFTAAGTSGQILKSNGTGAPTWLTIAASATTDTTNASNISSGTLVIARGGTNGSATPTLGGVSYGTGTAYAFTDAGTSGQVLMSNGSAAPTWGSVAMSVADDTTTNTIRYLTLSDQTSGIENTLNVSSTKLYFNPSTGVLNSTEFNSLSDANFKNNINTIENVLPLVNQLRGVSFEWKDTGKKSIGVIAQEVEEVFPCLVSETNNVKSVNYDGIIGILVQAIKDLNAKVERLENANKL